MAFTWIVGLVWRFLGCDFSIYFLHMFFNSLFYIFYLRFFVYLFSESYFCISIMAIELPDAASESENIVLERFQPLKLIFDTPKGQPALSVHAVLQRLTFSRPWRLR